MSHRCRTPARRRDDSGAIAVAMLIVLVGMTLSALLVPVLLVQFDSTRRGMHRERGLHAAQTGLDVAVGQIRAARDDDGAGAWSKLPCGPLAGRVDPAGAARYRVTIDYLPVDPRGQPDSWIAANRIRCDAGSGPSAVPRFARLRSTGADDGRGNRTLRATYVFSTDRPIVAGGLVRAYSAVPDVRLCLDGGSASPAAGTPVRMADCVGGSPAQVFAYEENLTLALVASKSAAMPLGMCLDAGVAPAAGSVVQFQPCGEVTRKQQQWSYHGASDTFRGTADGATVSGSCFTVRQPDTSGSPVVLGSACDTVKSSATSFWPDASVGRGGAGPVAGQLVNFAQNSRCLDAAPGRGWAPGGYLTVYPCEQAPDPTRIAANQRWTWPSTQDGQSGVTGMIRTNRTLAGLCLRSLGPGQYADLQDCPAGTPPANVRWTVYGDTGTYSTSYRIVDYTGNCLTPTTVPTVHDRGDQVSKVIVAPCDGSTGQQWNAPPSLHARAPLKDVTE
jgi:hypothetical protein